MTERISYHRATTDLALFNSGGKYWIGSYSKFCTHQTSEPPYVLIRGYFDSEEEGLQVLATLSGDEF